MEWAHQVTTYLRAAGLENEEQGIWHAAGYLDGDAAVWWRFHCEKMDQGKEPRLRSWSDLKKLLVTQFEVFNHTTDVRDQYQALRQTSSVGAYISKFRSLIVELPNEPEEIQVYQFLKGLKPEIEARTRTHKPRSLSVAMDIADEADRVHNHAYKPGRSGAASQKLQEESGDNFTNEGGEEEIALEGEAARSTGPEPMEVGAVTAFPRRGVGGRQRAISQ